MQGNHDSIIKAVSMKKFTFLDSLTLIIFLILIYICTIHISYQIKDVEAAASQTIYATFASEKIHEGNMLLNKSKYLDAIKSYDQVLKVDPRSVEALTGKGVALANLDRFEEAITWFDKAIKIDPKFPDALYNKAGALAELGKFDEASVWTNKALEIDKTYQNASNSKSLLLPND